MSRTALSVMFAGLLAIGGSVVGSQTRNAASPPTRQIDQIVITTGDPHELYAFFTETLQLPVAWPMTSPRAGVTTGGVGFGNVNLEAIQFPTMHILSEYSPAYVNVEERRTRLRRQWVASGAYQIALPVAGDPSRRGKRVASTRQRRMDQAVRDRARISDDRGRSLRAPAAGAIRTRSCTIGAGMRFDELADVIREHGASLAVEVTTAFLERHPDWRVRYGSRAMPAGVQDAGYHVAFLAAAVEADDPSAFAGYARWTARVLAARGIESRFLAENLAQVEGALATRLGVERGSVLARHFQAALDALALEPALPNEPVLNLTAQVFLQAIITGQRHAAVQIAKEALRSGLSLRELYIDVLQPALYEVGRRWESNRLGVAQEHIATAITQYVMAQVYEAPDLRTSPARGRIVLTGVEGELHSVGAVMVGDLLETSGFHVRFLGTSLPTGSILGVIRDVTPSHVGISATMLFNIGAVRQLIHAVRAEFSDRVSIVVGGAAFRTNPDLWRHVSADGYAADLRGIDAAFATKN